AEWVGILSRRQSRPAIVGYELSILAASGYAESCSAPNQARLRGADVGIHAYRVIVGVIAGRGSVVSEQGWDRSIAVSGVGQQANRLLVRLAGHHVRIGDVAIMAAEAEQDAADFSGASRDAGGQNFGVLPAVAECDGLAIQWAGILAPQCIAACIGISGAFVVA